MADATFGAPGGISQAIGDLSTLSQTNARNAMLPGALQLQDWQIKKAPAEIMNLLANTGLRAAEAGLKNESLSQMKLASQAMQDLSQGVNTGDGSDPVEVMLNMNANLAKKMMSVGAVDGAEKAVKNYQEILGHQGTAQRNQLMKLHAEHQARMDKVQMAGSILNGVTDQDSFDQAAQQWQQTFKEPAPFASPNNPNWALPYDPETVRKLQEKSLTYKDKLAADHKEIVTDLQEKWRDSQNNEKALNRQLREAQIKIAEAAEERRAKGGGKPFEPSQRQVDDAKDFLTTEVPHLGELKDEESKKAFNLFAKSVRIEAEKLMIKKRGIELEQAMGQALEAKRGQLDLIAPKPPTKVMGFDVPFTGGGAPTLKLKGQTQGETKPLESDPTKRVQGMYYDIPGKGRYKWDPAGDPNNPWTK